LAAQLWNFARIGICHTLLVDGKWVTLRVPYPMGFFAKWSEGRIDDPNARLEGQVAVGDPLHQDGVSRRRRQGEPAQKS